MREWLKDQILRQFTLVNRDQFNETRLRERKQGPEESTVECFYDVLDLCGKANSGSKFERQIGEM